MKYTVLHSSTYDRCVVCNTKLSRVTVDGVPQKLCCERCHKKLPITVHFDCSAISGLDGFSVELDRYAPFCVWLAAKEMQRMLGGHDFYLKGSAEPIRRGVVLCDGDEIVVTSADVMYNHCTTNAARAAWDRLPDKIEPYVDDGAKCYFAEIDSGTRLKDVWKTMLTWENHMSLKNCCEALLKLELKIPRLSVRDILLLGEGKWAVLPFKRSSPLLCTTEAVDLLLRKLVPRQPNLRNLWERVLDVRYTLEQNEKRMNAIERQILASSNELQRLAGNVVLDDYK